MRGSTVAESILEEAQKIIHGERAKTYGHPRDQFALAAKLWSDYLGVEVTPDDHAVMMILLKLSRVKTGGYHRDAAVDIAGYAGTLERLREPLPYWEREPRVWQALDDVPVGVEVTDVDGYLWKYLVQGWSWLDDGSWLEACCTDESRTDGPYTEVTT